MNNIVTFKTEKPSRIGKSVLIAGVDVKFDRFGYADVPERYVQLLLENGLELANDEDLKQYAEIKKKIEKSKPEEVPDIDIRDENDKLKNENQKLKDEIGLLKTTVNGLQAQIEALTKDKGEDIPEDNHKENTELDSMTLTELKALCKEVKLPEEEWAKLKIDALRSYIKDKLN